MEKVWFKLRQTDYPPPSEENILKGGEDNAPICLGHFIPDLKHIDFVLNRGAIEPFPHSMQVFHTNTIHFTWHGSHDAQTGGSLGAGAPLAAAAGLTLKGNIKLAFTTSVSSFEEYDRLDSYIVQPTKPYVSDCLDSDSLSEYTSGKKSWSMFMITGLRVARKGKRVTSQYNHKEGGGGLEADVPTIANAQVDLNVARNQSQKMEGSHTSDFVWAIRLAKVYKGMLRTDWSLGPYSKRATFAAGDEEVDVVGTVAEEGLEEFLVIEDADLGEAFVVKDVDGRQQMSAGISP